MSHHDGLIILPLSRLSFIVAAAVVVAIRGAIRAEKVQAQMALRLSFNSERAGEITIGGMPRFAERRPYGTPVVSYTVHGSTVFNPAASNGAVSRVATIMALAAAVAAM